MRRFLPFAALLGAVLVLGCQDLAPVGPDGLVPQFGRVKNCDPPDPHPSCEPEDPPPPVEGSYTLNDLGEGFAGDVSDDGKVVGVLADEATLWRVGDLPVSLGTPPGAGATSSWAGAISKSGEYVGGETWDDVAGQRAVLWVLEDVLDGGVGSYLTPLADYPNGNVSAVNDLGQAVGQGSTRVSGTLPVAVLWEKFGVPVRNLGNLELEGEEPPVATGAWAIGLNNTGTHIVGKTFFDFSQGFRPRATLWILTEGVVTNIVDLTENSDNTGDNQAVDVTEIRGEIRVVGYSTLDGVRRTTVWTVDAQSGVVTDPPRYGDEALSGSLQAINDSGVAVTFNLNVWDTGSSSNPIEILPELSGRCSSSARGINNGGDVAGRGGIKSKGRCTDHAVLWTKNR